MLIDCAGFSIKTFVPVSHVLLKILSGIRSVEEVVSLRSDELQLAIRFYTKR